jgi:hypothetical protein
MSVSEYTTGIGGIAFRSTDNFQNYASLLDQASQRESLVRDINWITQMNTVLATMKVHAEEYRQLTPPSNMRDVHSLILKMADRMDRVADTMDDVVNKRDYSNIDQATQDMNMITALAQQITALLKSK